MVEWVEEEGSARVKVHERKPTIYTKGKKNLHSLSKKLPETETSGTPDYGGQHSAGQMRVEMGSIGTDSTAQQKKLVMVSES